LEALILIDECKISAPRTFDDVLEMFTINTKATQEETAIQKPSYVPKHQESLGFQSLQVSKPLDSSMARDIYLTLASVFAFVRLVTSQSSLISGLGPSAYTIPGLFPTSIYQSYYNDPTATGSSPQPVISDPILVDESGYHSAGALFQVAHSPRLILRDRTTTMSITPCRP